MSGPVRELRLAVTVEDYDDAVRFYRDVLGLPDDRIEVGVEGVSPPIRLALEVADSEATARQLVEAGAKQIADAATTPWRHRNVRLSAPGPLQLTLFSVLDPE